MYASFFRSNTFSLLGLKISGLMAAKLLLWWTNRHSRASDINVPAYVVDLAYSYSAEHDPGI